MHPQVRKLMASSAPVPLHIPAAPEAADAEQLQAQQQALLTLGCRTMALPIGRGALTLGTCPPVLPRLCSCSTKHMASCHAPS